ncbi:MAG: rod shape-determining protein MreC [Parcubacteria group bacterium]|nr:rod shape-determining protein MreC [Parcubacteria group bacterium]
MGVFLLVFLERYAGVGIKNFVFSNTKTVVARLGGRGGSSQERALLETKQKLTEALVEKASLERENVTLRRMLYEYSPWAPKKQFAKVLAASPLKPNELFYIDQGSRNGIGEGDFVLAGEKTLVGLVRAVYEDVSLVESIFSRDLKITARVTPAFVDGLFVNERGIPELTLLPGDALVEQGNPVVTSGRDGVFIAGLVLGEVQDVLEEESTRLKRATVLPVVHIGNLEIVVVAKRPH